MILEGTLHRAYVGMQCFWGVESSFARLPGVKKTRVGYAGGTTQSPTYHNIGDHTEITELQFDPSLSSYEEILGWFFSHHDPTLKHKKQYQSAILYVDSEQKSAAEKMLLESVKRKYGRNNKVETYVQALDKFYQAENYHQKYWLRTQSAVYRELNLTDADLVDSTLAAKINAFLGGGFTDFDVLEQLKQEHGLSQTVVSLVERIARQGGIGNCH